MNDQRVIGTGVTRGRSGYWLFVAENGKRITGDLWGPYATEVEARRNGPALREHFLRVERDLGTTLGDAK